ncbi:MAG: LptF/LptG family permease [Treponema sp.]|nr:LptF/LptG family permease [Treponema sp.]
MALEKKIAEEKKAAEEKLIAEEKKSAVKDESPKTEIIEKDSIGSETLEDEIFEGEFSDAESLEEDFFESDAFEGETSEAETIEDDFFEADAFEGETSEAETIEDDFFESDAFEGETSESETIEDDFFESDAFEGETSEIKTVEDDTLNTQISEAVTACSPEVKELDASGSIKSDSVKKEKTGRKADILGANVLLKYLCKELFIYFAICFCFFFVVFFVNNILLLAETILRQHVKVSAVLKLILYCLPAIVAQSAPFATLVGFLMCLGRMVTDNEIMVLRATGQRYSLILIPVLAMGLLISVFSFVMNDYFLPLGILKFNRLKRQIVHSDPAVEIEPNSVKIMNGTTIVIGDVSDDNVIQDMVFFNIDSNGNDRIIVTGKGSVVQSPDEEVLMKFNMGKTSVFSIDRSDRKKFEVLDSQNASFNVFDSIISDSSTRIYPREMTSLDLWKHIKQMVTDDTVTKKRLNQYKLEFNKKFSIPFGSIFFAMLAFPLALVFGKRDGLTLGLIFGILISVLYWAASILGQMFGVKSGWNGFVMMWTPNVVIGIVGIILYMRLRKK